MCDEQGCWRQLGVLQILENRSGITNIKNDGNFAVINNIGIGTEYRILKSLYPHMSGVVSYLWDNDVLRKMTFFRAISMKVIPV